MGGMLAAGKPIFDKNIVDMLACLLSFKGI
jgi:hypothetical protein